VQAAPQPQPTQTGLPTVPPGSQAIDKRTGKPADPTTPPEFVEIRPSATASAQPTPSATTQASSSPTARATGTGSGGSGASNGNVAITSPSGGHVSGAVAIQGSASTPNMQYYRLDYSTAGGGWSSLGQWSTPVKGGTLATWSTAGLTAGTYTLRLTVQDAVAGTLTSTVSVTVG
jgi:hypothetical protein